MSQRQTILAALRAAGERGVTNVELNQQLHIFRYSARIHELRSLGHTIRTAPLSGSTVRFVLEAEATATTALSPPLSSEGAVVGLFDMPARSGSVFDLGDAA